MKKLYLRINRHSLFRISVIILTLTFAFLKELIRLEAYKYNINMLYVGEKISVPKLFIFFSNKGINISDFFILHGYFLEFLEGFLAFKLFGLTIGSYLFFDTFLLLLSFLLFIAILNTNVKNDLIFFIANLFFLGTNLRFRLLNDLITLIYIMVVYFMLKKKLNLFKILICGFIVLFNFFYSIESAYYTLVPYIFLILIFLKMLKIEKRKVIKIYIKNQSIQLVIFLLGCYLIAFILLNKEVISLIYRQVFIHPLLAYIIFKPEFPPFSLRYFYPYFLPICLLLLNFLMLIILSKQRSNKWYFFIFFFFLGLSNLYGVYIRVNTKFIAYDKANISYFINYQVLLAVFLLDYILSQKYNLKALAYFVIIIILVAPFWNITSFLPQSSITFNNLRNRIIFFFNLPRINDSTWITDEQKHVTEFVKKNTGFNDYVFVFNNEVLYYALFERLNPSIYYTSSLAEQKESQLSLINDLKNKKPKIIIYRSSYWTNNIDNIPQSIRLNLVNNWILRNYLKRVKIGETLLFIQ